MKPVIIGIHGLRGKPPRYVLSEWWKKSIIEGFHVVRLPAPHFRFEMAYWAHFLHERSQNPNITDQSHPQFMWEPYVPGTYFGPREPQSFRRKLKHDIHEQLLKLVAGPAGFMNIGIVSEVILHRMFEELEIYYHGSLKDSAGRMRPAKELIRNELAQLIQRHRDSNIMILAHSMGSIIAYDVLTHVVPDIPVHSLVTFGAPLGFPVIVKKIRQEMSLDGEVPLPTPASIQKRWLNFSDPDDVTCLNYNLRTQYHQNTHGVRPIDRIVYNNYECMGCSNPHKAYGYLRTFDMTQVVNTFMTLENAGMWERLGWVLKPPPHL